ncbi:hypothetical protein OEZ86_010214 [Tetradesmus obliquus]|nr:hypothetical protein OEZ86_010214 [Tetradesmus obliquus]
MDDQEGPGAAAEPVNEEAQAVPGAWGIGVSQEVRPEGTSYKVRVCVRGEARYLDRFTDVVTARLAYDTTILHYRSHAKTNYDPTLYQLTDQAALSKIETFHRKVAELDQISGQKRALAANYMAAPSAANYMAAPDAANYMAAPDAANYMPTPKNLVVALAAFNRILVEPGAAAAAAAAAGGYVTSSETSRWLAGLEQLAARGSAVDGSVLKLCRKLVGG